MTFSLKYTVHNVTLLVVLLTITLDLFKLFQHVQRKVSCHCNWVFSLFEKNLNIIFYTTRRLTHGTHLKNHLKYSFFIPFVRKDKDLGFSQFLKNSFVEILFFFSFYHFIFYLQAWHFWCYSRAWLPSWLCGWFWIENQAEGCEWILHWCRSVA